MENLDAPVQNARRVVENWDRVFDALSSEPRRQLVVSLLDAAPEQQVSLPEGAQNPSVPIDADRLRGELYHYHLPMLADRGFVEWQSDPLVATRGPRFDEIAAVFETIHDAAADLPESMVTGCRRLEQERQEQYGD